MNLIPKHMGMPVKPEKSTTVHVEKYIYTVLDILTPEEFQKFVRNIQIKLANYPDCHVKIYDDQDDDTIAFMFYSIEEKINPNYDIEYAEYLKRCKLKVEYDNHNEVVTLLRKLYDKILVDSDVLLKVKYLID